jgi:hypothetical protein
MISYKEYLNAKKIVDSYENQIKKVSQTCCDEPLIESILVNNSPPGIFGVTTPEFICKNCGKRQFF